MHSIRRAVLSSAISASRSIAVTARTPGFAAQVTRSTNVAKPLPIIPARFFTQSGRLANEEKAVNEEAAVEQQKVVEPESAAQEAETVSKPFEAPPVQNDSADAQTYDAFIRNLLFDAEEAHVRALFERFGEIADVQIARDSSGMSKGFAFVKFTTPEARAEAIQNLDGTFWHGRRITVNERQGTNRPIREDRSLNEPSDCLYIGNIPYETTDAELSLIFRDLKNVRDVRVAVDRTTGWPRGFAHVDFTDVESAKAARETLGEMSIGSRRLIANFAKTRTMRKARGPEQDRSF